MTAPSRPPLHPSTLRSVHACTVPSRCPAVPSSHRFPIAPSHQRPCVGALVSAHLRQHPRVRAFTLVFSNPYSRIITLASNPSVFSTASDTATAVASVIASDHNSDLSSIIVCLVTSAAVIELLQELLKLSLLV